MSGSVTVYISLLASNTDIKKKQQTIQDILQGQKIEHKVVDVSACRDDLDKMREIVGNPTALAPQVTNGDQYCGGYDEFYDAVENKELNQFLKLE